MVVAVDVNRTVVFTIWEEITEMVNVVGKISNSVTVVVTLEIGQHAKQEHVSKGPSEVCVTMMRSTGG
jgi:hypothetical protein